MRSVQNTPRPLALQVQSLQSLLNCSPGLQRKLGSDSRGNKFWTFTSTKKLYVYMSIAKITAITKSLDQVFDDIAKNMIILLSFNNRYFLFNYYFCAVFYSYILFTRLVQFISCIVFDALFEGAGGVSAVLGAAARVAVLREHATRSTTRLLACRHLCANHKNLTCLYIYSL